MTTLLIVLAISLGGALVTAAVIAVERSSRADAWRRIAEERRWNHDHRAGSA